MLKLDHLALRRGPKLLLQDADLTIHPGQKVGITGANGSGKSSLFALIRGELHPDTGDCRLPAAWTIAHVAQETPATDRAAIDYVMDGDQELRQVEQALQTAEAGHDGHRVAELHARLESIGGYSARSRAARLMHGLGFGSAQEDSPVRTFSGGWRMRLNLAQALMCRSDLLLLDEPTNHLDLDAVIWLEEWLRRYPGTLLLISHDRDFLDAVAGHIAHIEHQGIQLYSGNYSAFELIRAQQLANQQAAYEKQQREISHIRHYVDRFRAQATKARQAQSRLKALERMELIAPAHVDSPFHFQIPAPDKNPNPLLRLERVAIGYGEAPILDGVNLSLSPGDRIGLLGPNGAGKSTLIKLLAGQLSPLHGTCTRAKDLNLGYFAQHQLEQLSPTDSPLTHLQRLAPAADEQGLRNFLGGFGFIGERVLEPVAPLSGGEKARLVLALLVYRRPNLLLLDEPTNHLDLDMRHALTLALTEFEGAMVIVSHDRHLLRTTTDQLLLVADRKVEEFGGSLDEYPRWLAERRTPDEAKPAAASAHSAGARKDRKRLEAEQRQRLQPLRDRLNKLERELERLSTQRVALEAQLAQPEIYGDGEKQRLKTLLGEKAQLDQALARTEDEWLSAGEALEDAQKMGPE